MGWQRVLDTDGDEHYLWKQELGNGCGPSCVAMVARKLSKSPKESDIAGWIATSERQPRMTNLAGDGHDFHHQGTWNVQDALRKIGLNQTYTDKCGDFDKIFRDRCTKSRPGIAWIEWDDTALHWVVVLGPSKSDSQYFLVLDPAIGYSRQRFDQLPNYNIHGHHGVFRSDNWNGVVTTK